VQIVERGLPFGSASKRADALVDLAIEADVNPEFNDRFRRAQ
jgi:hypothetical protein